MISKDGANHATIDTALFIDHMNLAATEFGLATSWVCNFDLKKSKMLFAIPEYLEPIALVSLGYPNQKKCTIRKRQSLRENLHFNSFK